MGSFWDKLNKAADNFTNQFNNAYTNQGNNTQYGQSNQSGGLFDSFMNGFNAASQNAVFCKYLENNAQGIDLNSMSLTERNALMKNALEQCGADKTPNTTLGQIYPIIMRQIEEREKNIALPTAHSTCPPQCGESRDECEKCLKRRLAILEALYYIDQPEEYKKRFGNNSQNRSKQLEMKCSLCGAPLTSSMKVCEYCDTPVLGTADNQSSYLSFTEYVPPEQAAYDLIYEVMMEGVDKMAEPEPKKVMTAVLTAACSQAGVSEFQIKTMIDQNYQQQLSIQRSKMTMADINYMANEYHISVSTYLRGLFEGDLNLQSAAVYRQNKKIQEETRRNKEEHERKMQAIRDDYARWKQRNDEFWERKRSIQTAPQYLAGGGGGDRRNCGHCVNYVDGYCAYKGQDTNATDYCGNYRMR